MKNCSYIHYFYIVLLTFFGVTPYASFAQLGTNFSTTDNTECDGMPCDYSGPSIIINEIMMSPTTNDGSLWGGSSSQRGEWIELYNPNICEAIDISCYYLGNNANDSDPYPGGYVIPPGTVVPAAGFALIRGVNAAPVPANFLIENGGNVVELVVDGAGVCVGGGSRLWFPNSGGWFAFYDNNGIPQDAVSWASAANTDELACVPSLAGCGFTGTLPNYDAFPNDRKNYILSVSANTYQGQSIRRMPDGQAWSGTGTPTYATNNAPPPIPPNIICNGTAMAEPFGGNPPYTFLWNDPQGQTTQVADSLCAGVYCVWITDALNNTIQQCITVENISYDVDVSAEICQGETYTLPDNSVVSVAGEYQVLLLSGGGCDSAVTVHLGISPDYDFNLNPQICEGNSYTLPDGTDVSAEGIYNLNYQTVQGCDSNYTVNLSFYPDTELNIDLLSDVSCYGEADGAVELSPTGTSPFAFEWSDGIDHGSQASGLAPDNYSVEIIDANGCEAVVNFEIEEPQVVSLDASADTLICFGSTAELLAMATGGTGSFSYNWSHTASTNANSSVSPTEDTSYSVFAFDQNGCRTDTVSLNVSVINMYSDSLQVSSGDSLCAGGEIAISAYYNGAHPPYTYTWNNGLPSGPGPHLVSPDFSTNYTVTVSDDCGNEVSKDIPIVIWALPVPELTSQTNVSCSGFNNGTAEISVVSGTPDFTFTWSDGIDHGANAEGLNPGDYDVQISDANGCEAEISFQISQPLPLSMTASADELICYGNESELLAQASGGVGGFTYHWSHTASNNPSSTVSPEENTLYTVYATDANNCQTESIMLSVSVINMFENSLVVSDGDSICAGDEASISAFYNGVYGPYSYSWSHGLPDSPGPHSVSPDVSTVYTVTVSDSCGNSVTKDIPVVIRSMPNATLFGSNDISCYGLNDGGAQIAVSNGTPDFTFVWSDGQDHGAVADGLAAGDYSVQITDAHGCEDTLLFAISEPNPIDISLSGDSLICLGSAAQLLAQATGGSGTLTYHWNLSNADSGNISVSPNEETLYIVYAEDENGCSSESLELNVSVITMDLGLLSISNDTTICPGETVTISGFYDGNHPPYEYTWSEGLGVGPGPHEVSPSITTTYILSVADACGNELTAEVEVGLLESPVAVAPDALISGCSPLQIQLYDSINTGAAYTHEWILSNADRFQGNPVNFILTESGIYEATLVVTSPDGCSSTSENTSPIEVYETPTANFTASTWSTGINEPEIIFNDNSAGHIGFTWTIGNDVFQDQSELSYQFPDTGTYAVQLYVFNEFGCSDTLIRWVNVTIDHGIDVPNAFTPGGTGGNPYYDPNSTSNTVFYPFFDFVEEYQMSIYNRWGELIFESTEKEKGWNGTYRDEPCPQDVYVYKIELVYTDGKKATKVGDVTLFR